jgi:hypothetical protein
MNAPVTLGHLPAPERRRLNIGHKNGGKVIDIVAIGHATYKGHATWFFKARCEWDDGSHARDPQHIYEVSPVNLCYLGDESPEKPGDVALALARMNAYLSKNGRWDKNHQWIPYFKQGEEAVAL